MTLDSGYTTGPYPIVCAASKTICLTIDGGAVVGYYGNDTVTSAATLGADQWYNVILRYRIEGLFNVVL